MSLRAGIVSGVSGAGEIVRIDQPHGDAAAPMTHAFETLPVASLVLVAAGCSSCCWRRIAASRSTIPTRTSS